MLPWFFRYDHTNYSRWGAVYLADATQLPAEILQEFRAGNFVVKQSNAKYNQVDSDQSQEWLNTTNTVSLCASEHQQCRDHILITRPENY
jgi:hypothetical protein